MIYFFVCLFVFLWSVGIIKITSMVLVIRSWLNMVRLWLPDSAFILLQLHELGKEEADLAFLVWLGVSSRVTFQNFRLGLALPSSSTAEFWMPCGLCKHTNASSGFHEFSQ